MLLLIVAGVALADAGTGPSAGAAAQRQRGGRRSPPPARSAGLRLARAVLLVAARRVATGFDPLDAERRVHR